MIDWWSHADYLDGTWTHRLKLYVYPKGESEMTSKFHGIIRENVENEESKMMVTS